MALDDGDLEAAIELRRTMIDWGQRAGDLWDAVDAKAHLAGTLYIAGDTVQALQVVEEAFKQYDPSIHMFEIAFRLLAVSLEVEMGRPERAAQHLEISRKIIAQGEDWKGRAGFVDRAEGILAAAQGRPFANHFERAIAIFQRYSSPLEEAETLVSWGRALLSEGNRANADARFDAATGIFRRCGVGERFVKLIEERRTAFPHLAGASSPTQDSLSVFQREGDFWTIAHDGKLSRLRNIKGLGYLAHLLARPGERIHVIDLVAAVEGGASILNADAALGQGLSVDRGLGDAGEALDAQAREEYRRRQAELRTELEGAERDNDPGRVEAARHEFDLINDELSAAVGKGGRGRKSYAHSERARSLVTKHIRSAVDLIGKNDQRLGRHLSRSVHTGSYCAYLPEPSERIEWQV